MTGQCRIRIQFSNWGSGFSVQRLAFEIHTGRNVGRIEVDVTRRAGTIWQTRAGAVSIHQILPVQFFARERSLERIARVEERFGAKTSAEQRGGSRRGRMVIIAWRQTGGVPMLRTLRFNLPILSREERIGERTSRYKIPLKNRYFQKLSNSPL